MSNLWLRYQQMLPQQRTGVMAAVADKGYRPLG
jgi:hypothetical protein